MSGGSVSVTYSGGISQAGPAAALLSISGGHTGTINFNNAAALLQATGGTGAQFDNADGTYTFTSQLSCNGGDAGVDIINGSGGTFTFGSSANISNPTGVAFNVNGGTVSVTYNGSITKNNNAVATVQIVNGHATGTITFQTNAITVGSGTGLQFSNADGTYNFSVGSGNTILNGGDAGIDIVVGSGGTFNFGTGVGIVNPTGIAYQENTSTANVTYNGSIDKTNNANSAVDIGSKTGGTTTFNGQINASTTTANAINLASNTGGTINFTGGLNLTTTSGVSFNATGGGTVSATQNNTTIVNTITSTTGTALNVASSNISASGLTFRSISSNGASSGIILNTTGTAAGNGGLTVTGNSSGQCGGQVTVNAVGTPATVTAPNVADCTGGTIQNSTAANISLNSTKNVSLTRMRILNGATDGINVSNINGFSLSNCFVTDSGGVAGDRGIEMGDFSTGTAVNGAITISNSTVGPTPHDNFGVGIGSGTSTWNITGTVFDDSQLNSGFNFEIRNATVSSFLMDGCVLQGQLADGMQMQPASGVSATITSATIQNTTFQNNNIGMDLNHDGTSNVTYKILTNTFLNQVANSINFFSSAVQAPTTGGTLNGRFVGNVIGNAAVFNSGGGIGIRININGGADATVLVDNNTIRQIPNGRGIEIVSRNGTGGTDATVTNNFVNTDFVPTVANGGFSLANIFLQSNCVPICNTLRADVRGNTVPALPPTGELIAFQLALLETGASTFQLVDNPPIPSANASTELTEAHTNPAHNNTGSAGASAGVALIAGPINLPPAAPEPGDEEKPDSGDDKASPAPMEQVTAPANTDSITSRPFISSPRQQPVVKADTATAKVVARPRPAPAPAPAPVESSKGSGDEPSANPPVIMGDNLSWNVGTLPAGQSVTITFQVTVDNPFMGALPQVSNQGTVTADGGISVLTDDPSVGGMNDPTVTLVTVPPDLFVRDARVDEPTSGSTPMLFTLALSTPAPTGGIVVNVSTANGSATGGTCAGGADYESVSGGTATFAVGEQIKTFPVTVCSDATAEGDETLFLNVNSAPGAVIVDGQGLGTITANVAGTTLISELRTSGPAGAGDDFVEIYNNTDTPFTVPAGGYGLFKRGASCDALPVLVGTIPAATVIPQRGHYLFVGSTYSLTVYAGGNATLTTDIESDFNVGLFTTVDPLQVSTANRLDAVGFGISTGGVCALLLEGTTLPPSEGSTSQYSFVREFTLVGNDVPTPVDGNDNAADFTVVSTTPLTPVGQTAAPRLGAPGPENLAGPNLKKFSQVGALLLDQTQSASGSRNRVRDLTVVPNGALGTLSIRRRFTNSTGAPVTRLRFRIYDISTFPVPVGTADLRALTSIDVAVAGVMDAANCTANGTPGTPPCTVTAFGTTLDVPPAQPTGGGLNSSLAAGTITLGTPLAGGASINVQFLFGVQQSGSFRVFVFVEALP